MKDLIIIPARSGSTRVPNKNLALINGKPLIYYSIRSCLLSGSSNVIVSTDSPEIAEYSESIGAKVPFLRPKEISGSESTSISVIIHTLSKLIENKLEIPEVILFKPPTNPFITSTSIKNMMELKMKNRNIDSVMSIFIPRVSALSYLSFSKNNNRIKTQIYDIEGVKLYDHERSQDRPLSYANSPACKITETKYFIENYIDQKIPLNKCSGPTFNFRNASGYLINQLEAHDIDNLEDLEMTKMIIKSSMIKDKLNFYTHI